MKVHLDQGLGNHLASVFVSIDSEEIEVAAALVKAIQDAAQDEMRKILSDKYPNDHWDYENLVAR